MADLRADRYYDLRCDFCYYMWSTDFDGGRGMYSSREALLRSANRAGWRVRKGQNACPACVKKIMPLILSIVVLVIAFYICGREEDKKKCKQERYQKAFRITKYFGDTEIALFRFLGEKQGQHTCVWALIKFNTAYNDASLLLDHWKYYIVDKWEGNDEKEKNPIEEEVRELLYLLPYKVPIIDTTVSFDDYARISEKNKWSQWERDNNDR